MDRNGSTKGVPALGHRIKVTAVSVTQKEEKKTIPSRHTDVTLGQPFGSNTSLTLFIVIFATREYPRDILRRERARMVRIGVALFSGPRYKERNFLLQFDEIVSDVWG
ncbi:hypothetical protein GWI33_013312 [Rhynchophorus ferrugineus]|uniref:Uncharacterized protein n=1 Tax=Rhynchophorus ferrugineus TaxID=354439 RepID=A0A834IH92_RHYFE|nr:hypothetical protein GWI33_013312 [Rhynchophorus ferrugineus]